MLSELELSILRHSIGLDDSGRGRQYRNHFCAGGDDVAVCRALVSQGLMVEGQASALTGGDPLFHVTAAGIREAYQAAGRSQGRG